MDLQAVSETAVGVLVAIGTSYGIMRTEVATMKEQLKEMKEALEDLKEGAVKKSDCEKTHQRTDKGLDEMKSDIREIKKLLTDWMVMFQMGEK